ncbi:MAG: hypothetical protein PHY41_05780, partial [Candidatus Cloacimonetes bacterium]|nr:hypothetical protein [Candidatus Cloacimonadota bacterium]
FPLSEQCPYCKGARLKRSVEQFSVAPWHALSPIEALEFNAHKLTITYLISYGWFGLQGRALLHACF